MRSPAALVDAALLVWARNSARLEVDEVAAKLKLPSERLSAWESGDQRPSIAQLRKLAAIYNRPLAVFFLSKPPLDFEALRDFRRTTSEDELKISDALYHELRRAQELREAAISLLPEAVPDITVDITASLQDDSERVAHEIRSRLGVDNITQQSWRDSYVALKAWRAAVEALGVLVVNMTGVEVKDARGFSIAHAPLPLVALNSKDSPNGRIFTLIHELAHIALHVGGICEWSRETRLVPQSRRIEAFCNAVAAAVLLPATLVKSALSGVALPPRDAWPDELLRRLARSLSVSEEAFLRRLVTLKLATPQLYSEKREEYLKRYLEAAATPSKPIVTYEKRIVGSLGSAYLELAFGAYYEHRITLSDLSSYTGVRVDNLSRIEREAFGIARVPGAGR
jgi:Zn-dependent peptidase ImmA (M78 family)